MCQNNSILCENDWKMSDESFWHNNSSISSHFDSKLRCELSHFWVVFQSISLKFELKSLNFEWKWLKIEWWELFTQNWVKSSFHLSQKHSSLKWKELLTQFWDVWHISMITFIYQLFSPSSTIPYGVTVDLSLSKPQKSDSLAALAAVLVYLRSAGSAAVA